MSWDRPIHSFSYPNGEPQTPTRTPTSGGFGESAFQTPKLESSFYDPRVTWNTADPYASSPEFLKTPQRFGLATPSNHRDQNNLSEQEASQDFVTHGHQLSPDLDSASASIIRSGETPTAPATKRNRSSKRSTGREDENPDPTDSAKRSAASMQTPPPTSTVRRKALEDRSSTGRLAMAPTMDSTTTSSHLETPSRVAGLSPHLFSNIQASPDLFQIPAGTSTASPFFPQHRLFWDQDSELTTGALGLSDPYGDPFGPTTPSGLGAFNPDSVENRSLQLPQFSMMQTPAGIEEFGSEELRYPSGSVQPVDATPYATSFSTSPRVPTIQNEDPAMFLSSPARRFGFPESTLSPDHAQPQTRQPYHYQTEESKREKASKELKRAKSLNKRRASIREERTTSLSQSRGTRPAVKRSSTHSGLTPLSQGQQQSFPGAVMSGGGIRKTSLKGRSSPVKAQVPFPPPGSGPLQSPIQSVVLKIGKDGRAKTEMKVVTQSPTRLTDTVLNMDVDGSSTESDSVSSDHSDYPLALSQNPSFNFPESTPRRPGIARAHSTSRPHSKSSSYSSTVASSHSGRHSPWTSSSLGSGRRSLLASQQESWMGQSRRHSFNPLSGHTRGQSTTDSEVTVDDDIGDAQHALKQVLKGRSRRSRQETASHGSRSATRSHALAPLRSSPPGFGGNFDFDNASPTTVTDPDVVTPITDRQSNPSNGTRCVCNSMDNGGHLMIQCESCTHWLHTKCVGLDRQSLPPVYICGYCIQTPMRGGRIRDRLAISGHPPTSPLAHKSYRFRQ